MPAGAAYVRADVTRIADVEPMFARGLDAVCHIAGQVSIVRSFSDPVVDLRTNVEGTLNILRLCLRHKVRRLLCQLHDCTGSCRTFPTPKPRSAARTLITGSPSTRPKVRARDRVAAGLGFDFRVTSLRMYSVYGPGQ